jgi:hypothetical protein
MRRFGPSLFLGLILLMPRVAASEEQAKKAAPDWAMNATIIEACSCPMFCQCYFNEHPAGHHNHSTGEMEHYCKGNLAFRVNRGHYGDTKLDGAKFWFAGEFGKNLADGFKWAVVTFDPAVAQPQRDAITAILSHVYPVPMDTVKMGKDAAIEWKANKDRAVATLDGGKGGQVVLKRFQGETDEPVVIRNLRYIGAPRNDGFVLMPNEIQTWRIGENAFETRDTNGFMITFDITSKDTMPNPAG